MPPKNEADVSDYIPTGIPEAHADHMRRTLLAIIADTMNWDEARCREHGVTAADLEQARAPFKIKVGDA